VNDNKDVAVWPALFVPEADRMANLVRYCAVLTQNATTVKRVINVD